MPNTDRFTVLYDGQCEVCQAGVSWLKALDRRGRTDPRPIDASELSRICPSVTLEDSLRELHVVAPSGEVLRGCDAVARLARLFPATWPIGALASVPPFSWLARAAYRFVARNRYALSKCRGGACGVARPTEVRRRSPLAAFWSCYTTGMILRLPLAVGVAVRSAATSAAFYLGTLRRSVELAGGRLRLLFLGGFPADLVPIVFGERFVAVLYRGVLIDPGSPRMRGSLARHLRRLPDGTIRAVAATHHHEEHSGSLAFAARRLGVPLFVGGKTAAALRPAPRLPFVRRLLIGQPPDLDGPFQILGSTLPVDGGALVVLEAPGHCDDHVVFYDPEEKVLLAGDAFMGAYFSTPNPDVDSRRWIQSLERLLALDIEILVEGHGHVHTLRGDVPDRPGIVVRRDPKEEIREKLAYLRWLREQIEAGMAEGLPLRAVEASCFPWTRRRSWESFGNDELTRLLSLGHFSRSELIRSFVRPAGSAELFPSVYETRLYSGSESGGSRASGG